MICPKCGAQMARAREADAAAAALSPPRQPGEQGDESETKPHAAESRWRCLRSSCGFEHRLATPDEQRAQTQASADHFAARMLDRDPPMFEG
ncbi:MAG: hypothetical protein HYY96_05680 [Candidatus Tectomicrobia bacterium]|nr:hypothetical protein [Candidatus Tectomicrobia bacterium]